MNRFARIVSIVFHPLFVTTYLFLVFWGWLPAAMQPLPGEKAGSFIGLLFLVTALLPLINLFILRQLGAIKSLEMHEQRERIVPFLFIAAYYVGLVFLLMSRGDLDLSDNFLIFLTVAASLVVVSLLISLLFKASIHALAWGGFAGILLVTTRSVDSGQLLGPLLTVILVSGLVMSARLQLKAHTLREVMAGSMLGVTTAILVLKYIYSIN